MSAMVPREMSKYQKKRKVQELIYFFFYILFLFKEYFGLKIEHSS